MSDLLKKLKRTNSVEGLRECDIHFCFQRPRLVQQSIVVMYRTLCALCTKVTFSRLNNFASVSNHVRVNKLKFVGVTEEPTAMNVN